MSTALVAVGEALSAEDKKEESAFELLFLMVEKGDTELRVEGRDPGLDGLREVWWKEAEEEASSSVVMEVECAWWWWRSMSSVPSDRECREEEECGV